MASTISARLTDGSKIDIKVEDIDSTTILSLKELIAAVRRQILPCFSSNNQHPLTPSFFAPAPWLHPSPTHLGPP